VSTDPYLAIMGSDAPAQPPLGMPRSVRNNNPGNLRADGKSNWQGMTGVDPQGFVQFDTPENGQRALGINLANQSQLHGLNTVRGIVGKYAPPSDGNDTSAYIAKVAQGLGVGPDDQIDLNDPRVNAAMQSIIVPTEMGNAPSATQQASPQDASRDPYLAVMGNAADGEPGWRRLPDGRMQIDITPSDAADPSTAKTDQGLGFYQGLMRPLDNAAQWVDRGTKAIGIDTDGISRALGLPTTDEANAGHKAYIQGQEFKGFKPGKLGEAAGSIVGTAPILAVTANPWVVGAASGALDTSTPDNLSGTAKDALFGALAGKAGDMAVGGLVNTVSPKLSDSVRMLADKGVSMTPGQMIGGTFKRMEDAATSIPIAGDMVKNAQRRSADSFVHSSVQQTLDPIGVKLPSGLKSGHDAVDFAHKTLGDAYETLVSPLHMAADTPFQTGMAQIERDAAALPPERAKQFGNVIRDSVISQFGPGGSMSGTVFKQVDSKLGQLGRSYGGSLDPEQRQMADGFRAVQGELRDLMSRSNPVEAPELDKVNAGFAKLVRVEGASSSSAATNGNFSPAQLAAAVRRFDSSGRKSASARGNALMQDFAQAGREVLPSSVPDSGTPLRSAIIGGGGIYAAGKAGALGTALLKVAPAAIPLAAYTKLGQKALAAALLKRPAGAKALADALAKLKAPAAIAGGQLAVTNTGPR
jgi:hypothetical protein